MNDDGRIKRSDREKRYRQEMGVRIRAARLAASRSQNDLAIALWASKQLVCDMEYGRTGVSAWQLLQIADFLGADYQWLLSGYREPVGNSPLAKWIVDSEKGST